jgi:hypothetical protein
MTLDLYPPLLEQLTPDNVASLIAAGLAEPSKIRPTRAHVIGKDKSLELGAAEIFEMNTLNEARGHSQVSISFGADDDEWNVPVDRKPLGPLDCFGHAPVEWP